ncbi:SPOR domain-containing protein [Sphingosinicella sp. CPCC 101087]|uniref:SPOR domain-containing protein n=1 Tax=Sphingosinicella sp. CPCC 101087 TaxID=2497754 RepID=UPI00101DBB1C|nr:SPOR domain-containing protein [Sphingosinicella sp. CPCC 101087]
MNRTAFEIAASTIIVSMTMVACTAQSEAMRRLVTATADDSQSAREAARLHEQAARALQQGQLSQAVAAMENAVAASPRDAGYRLFLADIYMKSGRFQAARATFADVLELDPSNIRAGLSLSLMEIGLGRPQAAVAQLDGLSGRASPADLGLAYALAGLPERAIEILEPAARSLSASPRLRQNLALSYALAGDWRRARAVAAQDVSPADLGPRLQQWAALATPGAAAMQVASLLGVTPVADPGQPVRLALAPSAPEPATAYAEAETATFADAFAQTTPVEADSNWGLPAEPADTGPIEVAEQAPSYYLPAPETPAQPQESAAPVRYAAAARTLIRPQSAVARTVSAPLPAPLFERDAPRHGAGVRRGNSPFVVQLGAFSNEDNAERAWQQAERRFALAGHVPLTTTIDINGRTLHRVSVSGFATQAEAARLCGAIRTRGGACFVRHNAGDASVRWAARYAEGRDRNV